MNIVTSFLLGLLAVVGGWIFYQQTPQVSEMLGGPTIGWDRFEVGKIRPLYQNDEVHVTELCLDADCKTAWPSGGGLSTTTPWTANDLAQVVNDGTVRSIATSSLGLPTFADLGTAWGDITGTLSNQTDLQTALDAKLSTTTAASTYYLQSNPAGYTTNTGTVTSVGATVPTGLTVTGSPVTTSGTLAFNWDTGYAGVLTASSTNWNSFFDTPSTRITAGTDLAWGGNTLNFTNGSGYITGNETITFSGDAVGTGTTSIALSLATNSVADNEIDYTAVTLADFTNDAGYLTNITGQSFLDLADTPASYIANRIPYMTGSAITTNANFVFDGTKLGVGTANPILSLDVRSGNIGIGYGSHIYAGIQSAPTAEGGNNSWASGTAKLIGTGWTGANDFTDIYTPGSQRSVPVMRMLSNGNVGIGTTNPSAKLDVRGTVHLNVMSGFETPGVVRLGRADAVARFHEIIANNSTTQASNYLDFSLHNGTLGATSSVLRLVGNGNVGIGTTNPVTKLSVNGHISQTSNLYHFWGTDYNGSFATGDYGFIGYNSTAKTLDIVGGFNASEGSTSGIRFGTNHGTSWLTRMQISYVGNVGIGVTEAASRLQVAGSITPGATNTYNLGTSALRWGCLYYDNSTIGTCASDERLKDNINKLSFVDENRSALDKVTALTIRSFFYKDAPGIETHGLIAQEIINIAPELVTVDSDGYYAIRYGDLQWLMLESIQELNIKLETLTSATVAFGELESGGFVKRFFNALIAWFADATNGIGNMYASVFKATDMICIGETCINESDLKDLLDEKTSGSGNYGGGNNNGGGGSSDEDGVDDNTNNIDDTDDVATGTDDGTGNGGVTIPEDDESEEEGYKWYNPSGFEAIITAAIRELFSWNLWQDSRLEKLEKENAELKKRLDALEAKLPIR